MAYFVLSLLVFVSVIFCVGQLLEPVKVPVQKTNYDYKKK